MRIIGLRNFIGVLLAMTLWVMPLYAHATQISQQIQTTENNTQILTTKNKTTANKLVQLRDRKQNFFQVLKPEDITQTLVEQVALDYVLAHANFDGAEIARTEAQQTLVNTQSQLRELEEQLQKVTLGAGKAIEVKKRIATLQKSINLQRQLYTTQQEYSVAVERQYQLAKNIYKLNTQIKSTIEQLFRQQQRIEQQKAFYEKENTLQQDQQHWLTTLRDLNAKLQNLDIDNITDRDKERIKLEIDILKAQEMSNLTHIKLVLARLQNQLRQVRDDDLSEQSVTELNNDAAQLGFIQEQLARIRQVLDRKTRLLQKRKDIDKELYSKGILAKADFTAGENLISSLQVRYNTLIEQLDDFSNSAQLQSQAISSSLSDALSRRQGLPGLSLTAWASLGEKLMSMPGLALDALNALTEQVKIAFKKITRWQILGIIIAEILLLSIWFFLRLSLERLSERFEKQRKTLSKNILYTLVKLLRRNITGLFIFIGIILIFYLSQVPMKSFTPIFALALVWFTFKFAIGLAKQILLESERDASGRDVHLYKGLKWVLLGGGLLTMLTVLAHQLPVEYEVTDFFNRLFMIFMLAVGLLLLRSWGVVPALFAPYIDQRRAYLKTLIWLLSFLIPLSILSTAIIGFLGYVELAWTICRYEGMFLIILTAYILSRGFLQASMEYLSELFIRRLHNGWLWTQAVLRPLDRILRIALFIFAIYILFLAYGWDADSYVVMKVKAILDFHLLELKTAIITPLGIIKISIAAAILFWVAKWTREFAFRWLFSRTRDIGLRNSLAAFTQYFIVFIGILVALQVIGIDLTGISFILGGLAIGAGFGLRDLAKNYVSGLLMLIERPVRAGDLVTVGNFEGMVTDIGMRAMTVKTWDHMEVLVPNSETFEKPFTNWTHQDSIVRTVVVIKINRDDDPLKVKDVSLTVLEQFPEIVSDPSPQVFFTEMSEELLEFQIRYFINLQQGVSRAATRSKVLFQLWQAYVEAGIKPPYPSHDVFVRSLPSE